MSVNFYDLSGVMVGCDLHDYVTFAPPPAPPGTPLPVKCHPHAVGAPFAWSTATPYKICDKVSSDGLAMLQGGYDVYLVPHVPVPVPPPHPTDIAVLAKVVILSGTKAQMSVHSVTGQGDPLATCVIAFVGINVNCNDPLDLPTGQTFQLNTVRTSPTLGDYVGAVVGYAVDAAIGFGVGKILDKRKAKLVTELIVKHILRRAPDATKQLAPFLDPAGFAAEKAQQWVDDLVKRAGL